MSAQRTSWRSRKIVFLRSICCAIIAPSLTARYLADAASTTNRPPNIVLFVTDQERAPTAYEDEKLSAFRRNNLSGYRELGCSDGADSSADTRCIQFMRHYTSSTACTPSRANLFTGQYSSIHGVRNTEGMGKTADSPEMRFLPTDVPTMGHYFEAAGYETRYIGKWHLSYENIGINPTKPLNGDRDREAEGEYLDQDRLSKYGFHGWIGPEPHGVAKVNTGFWRDEQFVEQALEWINARNSTTASNENEDNHKPFLLVLNIVNPHDICLWRLWKAFFKYPFNDGSVPSIPPPPTCNEDLSTKPSQQREWKRYGKLFFGDISPSGLEGSHHRQFYYYMQKLADEHIATVVKALKDTPFWDNTIVVRTSDHGEALGAHGLFQKWYSAYDEVLNVPLVVSSPLFRGGSGTKETVDYPTSSVDLLPTLLSLAGLNEESLRQDLRISHSETHSLVGSDLSPFILADRIPDSTTAPPQAIYSVLEDHVSKGQSQRIPVVEAPHPMAKRLRKVYHFEIDAVKGPSSMEVVVANIDNTLWKLVRSYDDPARWSSPHKEDTYVTRAGYFTTRGTKVVKTEPLADEWELYNLSDDPLETINLANEKYLSDLGSNAEARATMRQAKTMKAVLVSELNRLRETKLLKRRRPLPNQNTSTSPSIDHDVDMFDLAEERFGSSVGPLIIGSLLLYNVWRYQEPLLLALAAFGLTLTMGISISVSIWLYRKVIRSKIRIGRTKLKAY